LAAFVSQVSGRLDADPPAPAPPTAPAPPPAAPAVSLRQLREALVANFTESDLQVLCADIEQALTDAGTPLQVNLEIVGGGDKRGKALKLIEYLNNRGLLRHLIDAARAARPGLLG
jgi:hypothetical protein